MRLVKYGPDNVTNLPVGGGAIVLGAAVTRGATPGSNNGMLIKASGASAIPDIIGILRQELASGDASLIAGTKFTTRPVQIVVPGRIVRIQYSLATADLVVATQAVSTTTITLTSLEDDIDAAFLYVDEGTGAGQTNYLTASGAGSATLKAAFGTNLDTTSYIAKILPRFHQKAILNSDGTMLASQAAVGAVNVMVVDSFIERNGRFESLDPTKHAALTGLSSLRSIKFWADIVIRDTAFATID